MKEKEEKLVQADVSTHKKIDGCAVDNGKFTGDYPRILRMREGLWPQHTGMPN
jgi:hypothetical protein